MCYIIDETSERRLTHASKATAIFKYQSHFLLLYAPLSIALSVFFLFTGSLLYSILCLGTIIWLILPQLIHKFFHLRTGHLLVFFYLIFILLGYSFGLVLSFHRYIPFYGEFIHLLGSFLFCLIAASIFCYHTKQRPNKKQLFFANLFCFSLSIAVGLILELLQTAISIILLKATVSVPDLIFDLIACLLGATIFCILTTIYVRKNIHTYPLYAFEDFATLNVKINISYAKVSPRSSE